MKYLIEMQPGATRAMAFGLTWRTTLGNDPDAVAAKIAAREKAVAYTRGGARSTVVGLLRTRKRAELPGGRIEVFSAAAVFARAFARGPVALTMKVPGGIWLAAAFDGVVVLGTDVIHGTEAQARAHLEQLQATYRGLTVYGDHEGQRKLPPNALADQLDASTRLKRTALTYARIPVPVWMALGGLAAWLAADYGYALYRDAQYAKREAERLAAMATDPVASWQAAIAAWAAQIPEHGGGVLQTMLREIERVPLSADRWELAEIDCAPAAWRCSAHYRRGHLGTNQGLRDALPSGWTLHWPDLQTAVAQWPMTPPAPSATLQADALPDASEIALSWASMLQQLAPAFADLALGEPAAAAIAPPVETRPDGTQAAIAFPRHHPMRLPTSRELIVNGPMRTLYLLTLPMGSTIARLQVRRTPLASADIAASALSATLTGRIHAQ